MPVAVREVVKEWRLAGCPRQDGIVWPRARWIEAFPEQSLLFGCLPDRLARADIREACRGAGRDGAAAQQAFLVVMAWGYGNVGYGPWRTLRIFRENASVASALAAVTSTVAATGGIRRTAATRSQYLRSLDSHYIRLRQVQTNDDGEPVDGVPRNWHAGLPTAPDGFLEETTFGLAVPEADYLTERIVDRCPGTYLAHLVRQSHDTDTADAPWTHPAAATAPAEIGEHLHHASAFSDVMHGASLLYGLILAELVRERRSTGADMILDRDLVDVYQHQLAGWRAAIEARHDELQHWDRPRFWQLVTRTNPRIPPLTRQFVQRWIDLALSLVGDVAPDVTARRLVASRERQVKRSLARVSNPRALERWSGRSGTSALQFRWPQVRQVTSDIVAGRHARQQMVDARG